MSETQTEYTNIYEKALQTYGVDAQIDMLIEEMSELIVELQHRKRGRPHKVPEEFADVEILMKQLRPLFDSDDNMNTVTQWHNFKLSKLLTRLNKDIV